MEKMEYLESFLDAMKADGKSKCTLSAYKADITRFLDFFSDMELDNIRYSDLRRWANFMEDEGFSATTRCRKISSVKSFFRYLCRMEAVIRNPTEGFEFPKVEKKQPVVITNDQASDLLFHAKNDGGSENLWFRDYAIIATFLFTGIRREELTNIAIDDVNFKANKILIHGKGSKQRTVYMNDTLRKILSEYISNYRERIRKSKNSKFLFPTFKADRVSVSTVNNIVNKFFKSAGIKKDGVSAHILRKRFATSLFENTHDIALTSKMLGHSSPTVTMRYVVIGEDSMRNAAMTVNF